MKRLLAACLTFVACAKAPLYLSTSRASLAASTFLAIGLTEGSGTTFMKTSGAPFTYRYRYLANGWADNWGYGVHDGRFARTYMDESAAAGFVPALEFYQLVGMDPYGEDNFLAKAQTKATAVTYFNDFKLLMQRAKDFGKPVLVMIEADGWAEMEQQSGDNPNAAAVVGSTGIPELAGLPDTVAGWGRSFVSLRDSVGATNVRLGLHVSAWAGGVDVMYGSGLVVDLAPQVSRVSTFLNAVGLASYDFLVADPLDRDADYHLLVNHQQRWWKLDGGFSDLSPTRYAEWLRQWNVATGKPWTLWQIPLGTNNQREVANDGTQGSGWRDNRSEYFFGADAAAHRQLFMNAGVTTLLFGEGANGQTTARTDNGYLVSAVKQYVGGLDAGGTGVADAGRDGGSGPVDAGVADAGVPDAGRPDAGQPDAGQADAGHAPSCSCTCTVIP